ncbi:MAG: hypothetical protein OSA98_12100, partial [Rubripirellula sp.]|nr:hypothetical protein [Rubripirellula sp.]
KRRLKSRLATLRLATLRLTMRSGRPCQGSANGWMQQANNTSHIIASPRPSKKDTRRISTRDINAAGASRNRNSMKRAVKSHGISRMLLMRRFQEEKTKKAGRASTRRASGLKVNPDFSPIRFVVQTQCILRWITIFRNHGLR